MTIFEPRCPALHPDLPYSRCGREEGHGLLHRNFTDLEWDDTMHPDGRLTWNHDDADGPRETAVPESRPLADWEKELLLGGDDAEVGVAAAAYWRARAEKAEQEVERLTQQVANQAHNAREDNRVIEEQEQQIQELRDALRAEKAEALRDDTAHMAKLWKETARRAISGRNYMRAGRDLMRCAYDRAARGRETAEAERDEARARLAEAAKEIREQGETIAELAAEPRPLTADAIETVLHDILPLTTERLGADDIADIAFDLHAALTEPQRPKGAEDWEDWLIHTLDYGSLTGQQIEDLANRVAHRVAEEKP